MLKLHMSLSIFFKVVCCTRNRNVRVDKQKMSFRGKAMKRDLRGSLAVYSGYWWEGKDLHLSLPQIRVILKFCVKLQYLCSSKESWKSDSAKKKKKITMWMNRSLLFMDWQKRSAWLVDHQARCFHQLAFFLYNWENYIFPSDPKDQCFI